MAQLKDKRTLILGAGSGIGRAVTDRYLEEGAQVAALELSQDKCDQLATDHPEVVLTCGDAVSIDHNRTAVKRATDAFGGLDVLVNCVGLFDFYTGIEDLDDQVFDAAFDEAFRVNVKSQLASVKAAVPALTETGGTIILTASTSSFYPGRGGILYIASKFAVRGAVIALAHELAPDITVNSVAPGGTLDTDLRGLSALGMNERSLGKAGNRAKDLKSSNPLGVALTARDHADSYVFLASPAARGMTGRFLHPDGGAGVKR
ncbi:MAG: 3-(cis-5,6-dihydroxycyclohexa-1,3-dien-1-yl)propanoate dehydrogenase [Actinophytocola sp.]|nr:3-(cis-5,6-dihydroxycyclohexa-1,3-dien-1-yl)propanoate dehydrogenase [Actinophytocola sp.]MQA17317.1 3-(cis-5,6-dihydroxycyclohexa-1,3-dien-1-yl)propanoate dehydrogenase [Pseudonocardiaceae bacterium]